jgi:hypothetical protein
VERSGAIGLVLVGVGVVLLTQLGKHGLGLLSLSLLLLALGGYFLFASFSRARRSKWKGSTHNGEGSEEGNYGAFGSSSSFKHSHSSHHGHDAGSGDHGGSGDGGGGDGGGD